MLWLLAATRALTRDREPTAQARRLDALSVKEVLLVESWTPPKTVHRRLEAVDDARPMARRSRACEGPRGRERGAIVGGRERCLSAM